MTKNEPTLPPNDPFDHKKTKDNLMTLILAVILAFLLVGVAPVWPHSVTWGYYPSSGIGMLLAILVIYLLLKRT